MTWRVSHTVALNVLLLGQVVLLLRLQVSKAAPIALDSIVLRVLVLNRQ